MVALPASVVAALEADRDSLNARFMQRLRSGAKIDGEAFLDHLEQAIAPLVEQINDRFPERTRHVLGALYDVSLDLFTASLLGPEAKSDGVKRVWTELLPTVSPLLARDPQAVAGSLCNAAVQISQQAGARPQQWLEQMKTLASSCTSKSDLLKVGVISAWQSGLVQFRSTALRSVKELDATLAARLFHLPASPDTIDIVSLAERLSKNRWMTAEQALAKKALRELLAVGQVGAFSGYGGLFRRPPTVRGDSACLQVSDGTTEWELLADLHGAWFRKTGDATGKFPVNVRHADLTIDHQGTITWHGCSLTQPHLQQVTSVAVCDHTLAVTTHTSHHLFLYTLAGEPIA